MMMNKQNFRFYRFQIIIIALLISVFFITPAFAAEITPWTGTTIDEVQSVRFCEEIYEEYTRGWENLNVDYMEDSLFDIGMKLADAGWFFKDDTGNLNWNVMIQQNDLMNTDYLTADWLLPNSDTPYIEIKVTASRNGDQRSVSFYCYDYYGDTPIKTLNESGLSGFAPKAVIFLLNNAGFNDLMLHSDRESLDTIEDGDYVVWDEGGHTWNVIPGHRYADPNSLELLHITKDRKRISFYADQDEKIISFTLEK